MWAGAPAAERAKAAVQYTYMSAYMWRRQISHETNGASEKPKKKKKNDEEWKDGAPMYHAHRETRLARRC